MVSRILAFRPASVVARLTPRSGACPLSGREVLGPLAQLGLVLPVVRAPIAAVARGALVAAKELRAALGLALPPGVPAAQWFDGVTRAADELAAGLPILLAGDVAVAGEVATQVERASAEAWALADAGLTHVAIDLAAVDPPERGRVLVDVARAVAERGVSVEVVLALEEGAQAPSRAAAIVEEAQRAGMPVDLASLRCPRPGDDGEARVQAAALARLRQALAGVPVMRRGPVTGPLLELLRGSPVTACEDGGAAAARAFALMPQEAREGGEEHERARTSALERAAAELSGDRADQLEARVYVDALEIVDRLGASGSATALSRALEDRLEER